MILSFIKSGNGSYGGTFNEPLRYLYRIISDRFKAEGIEFSFEEIEILLQYPPLKSEIIDEQKQKYIDWYSKLPIYYRGKKMLRVSMPFSANEENLTNIFRLIINAFDIIALKKKKDDVFDAEKIRSTLQQLEKELQNIDLQELNNRYKLILRQETIELYRQNRIIREQSNDEKNRLIYDIRFSYYFENIGLKYFFPHDNIFCNEILEKLRQRKFKLPNYTHLYIKVSDTFENALYHAVRAENWYVYGIAVLEDYADYTAKTEIEKQRIVFDLIKEGLTDIAKIDKLDIKTLNEVLDEVERKYF